MTEKNSFFVVFIVLLLFFVHVRSGSAAVFDNKTQETQTQVSPAVTHIQENFQTGSIYEAVNILDINLNDPYTKLELGIPSPINSLKTVSQLVSEHNYDGHRIVGATNAAFFLGNGYPANLLAQNNKIINYGILGEKVESPTQQPVAFGISKTGQAIADYYSTTLSFTVNNQSYPINLINNTRGENKTVLYTPDQKSTGTNAYGVELLITTDGSKNTNDLNFGDRFSGTISGVTQYGQQGNSTIPQNGFVISIQNRDVAAQVSSLPIGTPIDISLTIEDKWMDAQYILAGGPLIVKDGAVNISMPTNSSFASSRQPRTAVAVDSTGKRVFLVTVDGRQSRYSNGASLQDLGSYLISKGASAAINLDGGGSTAMVVRQPGGYSPLLVNRPSDGAERKVSAILQVVNTAPAGKVKYFTLGGSTQDVMKGASFQLSVNNAYDEYLNPLTVDPATVTWTVEGSVGMMDGAKFTATTEGTGKIIGEKDGFRAELPVHVIDFGNKQMIDSFDHSNQWTSEAAKAEVAIASSHSTEPIREGSSSLKLTYDFTTDVTGTKAAYAVAQTPISIKGTPKEIGVWVVGDGNTNWLRGTLIDGSGNKHNIDFTSMNGLNGIGWKYVTAEVPSNIVGPLKFERIYVTQPNAALQSKGQLYFDQLQAVYTDSYEEPFYTDVADHWAINSIEFLNTEGLIKGYDNGTFKPDNPITRAEAATIIARELKLTMSQNSSFNDVASNHYAYKAIAAVAEKGIIIGRNQGFFVPEGQLTRAEMATILTRAYTLTGTAEVPFTDVLPNHWGYSYIQTLVANDLSDGFPDQTFKPDQQITRAQFATLLERVLTR